MKQMNQKPPNNNQNHTHKQFVLYPNMRYHKTMKTKTQTIISEESQEFKKNVSFETAAIYLSILIPFVICNSSQFSIFF